MYHKCEKEEGEFHLPNKPAKKAHNITISEDIDIDKYDGFKNYRNPDIY